MNIKKCPEEDAKELPIMSVDMPFSLTFFSINLKLFHSVSEPPESQWRQMVAFYLFIFKRIKKDDDDLKWPLLR